MGGEVESRRARETLLTPHPSAVELLAHGSLEPVFSVTPSGRILNWTRRAEVGFGYSRGEAIGRLLIALVVAPDAIEDVQRALVEAFATGGSRCTGVRRRKDGTLFEPVPMRLVRSGQGQDASVVFHAGREAASPATPVAAEAARPTAVPVVVARETDPLRAALDRIRLSLDADAAALVLLDGEGQVADGFASCAVGAPPPLEPGRGFADLVAGNRGPMLDDHPPSAFATLLGVAVLVEGRPVGILQVGYRQRQTLDDASVRLLELGADLLAATLAGPDRRRGGAPEADLLRREINRLLLASFSPPVMLQHLASTLVPRFADWCAFDLVDGTGVARRVAAAHREPSKAAAVRALAEGAEAPSPGSSTRVLRSAIPDVAFDAPVPEELAAVGGGSHLVLPLQGRLRLVGAATFVRSHGRRFDQTDLTYAEDVARRAALEVENALLVDSLQRTRDQATRSAERYAKLREVTGALSEALTPVQVVEVLVRQARDVLGASGGAIAVLAQDHAGFEVVGSVGEAEALSQAHVRFPTHAALPLADAGRSNQPVLLEHVLQGSARYPYLAHGGMRQQGALAAVPLLVDGRLVGSFGLTFPDRRVFHPDDVEFMRNLARHAADAIERARLYNAERSARALADAEAHRAAFLADASRVLSASFDYRVTLDAAARLTVPAYADWCAIYLRRNDGTVHCVAAVHGDLEKAQLARELLSRPAPDAEAPGGPGKVLRTGKAEIFDELPGEMLAGMFRDERTLAIVRRLGVRSQIVLPLVARGRTLGALALCSATLRRHTSGDLQLLEELARRAALAVDNSRLYHEVEEAYRRKEESIQALKASEERYRLLVDGATDYALFLLDAEGRIQSWNPGAQRLLGYTADEVIGRTAHMFYTPEDVEARWPDRELEEAVTHGRCEIESLRVRKDGTRYWANVVVTPLYDEAGRLRGFSKLHRDLTETRRAHEELETTRQRVASREKLATMGSLVSGVAHEIRTPLTAIANSLHLMRFQLERGKLQKEAAERHTALALDGVDRINKLVQDLRRFHRVDARGHAAVGLESVVPDALDLFQAAHRGRVLLSSDLRKTRPAQIDVAQVQQVILNLLQNASEAMPHGGKVEIRTLDVEGQPTLVVHDEGMGMTADVKARMFEEFFTTKPEGTGLGLSIVRRVAELHGASITCESEPGKGTTFTLTFPVG